jgi:hypothetical protein
VNRIFWTYVLFLFLTSTLLFLIAAQVLGGTSEPIISYMLCTLLVHLVCEKPFKLHMRKQLKEEAEMNNLIKK